MTLRRIDSMGPMAVPASQGESTQDKAQITSSGFEANDSIDVQQPGLFDSAISTGQSFTAAHISTAAEKLLSDLPTIVREANSDIPKIADTVNDHVGRSFAELGYIADADIEAAAFLVLMEASKSAQEDLKSIMDGVKAINKEKEGWRKVQDTVNKLITSGSSSSDDDDDK